jgi:DNA-binding GntR family transcriptional regulator
VRKLRIADNLTTRAYKTIKNYIWEGRLDERLRLTEEFLSGQLGISKSPIREALNRLENEGLIRIEPRRGAYLRTFSIKEIQDLYGVREALEVHAISAVNLSPELVEKLQRSVDRLRRHVVADDKFLHLEEALQFHAILADDTGNEYLARMMENVRHQVWLFRRKTYDVQKSGAVDAHAEIVNALAKGNKIAAQRLMRDHICTVRNRLITQLESQDVLSLQVTKDGEKLPPAQRAGRLVRR